VPVAVLPAPAVKGIAAPTGVPVPEHVPPVKNWNVTEPVGEP
jgi:hypothetical protein